MTTPVITAPRTFTVTTKRGDRKTVQSTLTHEEAADICAKLDSDFARDLALAFREWKTGRRRFFSGPQTAWLQILANEELGRRREHERGGDFVGTDEQVDAIFRLFGAAGAKLKWPKIRLSASHPEQGERILRDYALYVAGAKSAHPGWIAVKEKDGYTVGHLATDGFFFWHPRAEQARHKGLLPLLKELATDPLKTAREYGGLTGNCCFCGLPLTDPRSTEQGFGKVCAEKWGLEWGNRSLRSNGMSLQYGQRKGVVHDAPSDHTKVGDERERQVLSGTGGESGRDGVCADTDPRQRPLCARESASAGVGNNERDEGASRDGGAASQRRQDGQSNRKLGGGLPSAKHPGCGTKWQNVSGRTQPACQDKGGTGDPGNSAASGGRRDVADAGGRVRVDGSDNLRHLQAADVGLGGVVPWGGKREPVSGDAQPTPENAPPRPAESPDEEIPTPYVLVLSTGSLTFRDGTFSAFASDLFAGARHFPQELDVRSERTGDVRRFALQDVHKDREGDTTHVSYRAGELLLTVFND